MPRTKRGISPFFKQCFVTAAVGSNIIGHGCVIGYPAILLPQLSEAGSPVTLAPGAASWFTSILGITQLVGSFITPPIMGRYGRKAAHYSVTIPVLVGWFITTMATNFEALLIGRILQGLSIGMMAPLRSVLIGEYSSPKNRGAFLTVVSLTQAFGVLFVHLVGSLLSWQQTAVICVFFSFTSLIMTIYSPESPSWLVSKGRIDECRKVFRWLRGSDEEDELDEMIHVRVMFEKARASQRVEGNMNRIKEVMLTIQKKEFYKPIILMMHAYMMVQFAGGTTMAAYSTTILYLIMGPGVNVHFWMIFLDTQRFIFNCLAVFIINKIKRRTMIFLTGGLCVLSQLATAAYVYTRNHGMFTYDAIWIPALLINLQFFTVATGMLPMPNVIGGEVFPLEYRNIGGSISLATMSVSFFVVLKTFIGLVESIGIYGTYVVYAGLLTYCLTIIWMLLPETKGKTLQQIEEEFRGRPLTLKELESKLSLHACPVESYKIRKMSRRCSTPLLH